MKNQRGQAALMSLMVIGIFLAGLIYYGWFKEAESNNDVIRVNSSQIAHEVLTASVKKIQQLYSNDGACDPDRFEEVLKKLPDLPATYSASTSYVSAYPATPVFAGSTAEKQNRCVSAGNTGCRQLAVEQDNRAYIVTVGKVSALDVPAGWSATSDCPRDATVRLKLAIRGFSYFRKVTLLNLCTYTSCNGASYTGSSSNISTNGTVTLTCGPAPLPARRYGDIVGTDSLIDSNEIHWARRYLESGGGSVGFTRFLEVGAGSIPAGSNGSCPVGAGAGNSNGQCIGKNCIPAFDLDRSGNNNEGDLAIMEYYLRGFLSSLPVRNF